MNIYKDLNKKELEMRNNRKGFTLIELIIVTIILGILAAVAVPRYIGTVNKSGAAAEDAVLSFTCKCRSIRNGNFYGYRS